MLLRPLAIATALLLGTLAASLAHAGTGSDSAESSTPSSEAPTVEHASQGDSNLAAQLDAATGRAGSQDYFLTYKFAEGDVVRTVVAHSVTVETTIQGNTQEAKSTSNSGKVWTITDVAENGDITFELMVEYIQMSQEVSDREEVKYDSRTDDHPPIDYEEAASTVGTVLAKVTINHHGRVIERTNPAGEETHREREAQLGFGDIAVPLPESNVKVGDQWFLPMSYRVRLPSGQYQLVQMRHRYQLEAVEGNIAVISLHTERLTPVNDPQVESQLMQQMQDGEIRFDIEAGRMVSKSLNLDEMVIGFQGANSRMKYIGRYRERAVEGDQREAQAATPAAPAERVAAVLAHENEGPLAGEDDGASRRNAPSSGSPARSRRFFRR